MLINNDNIMLNKGELQRMVRRELSSVKQICKRKTGHSAMGVRGIELKGRMMKLSQWLFDTEGRIYSYCFSKRNG